MTDDLHTRIIEVQLSHIPIDYAGGIECACGTECQPQHGGIDVAEQMWADHVADAVIETLEADYVLVPKGHALARIHAAREAAKASDFQDDDDDTECDTTWVAPGEIAKMMGTDDD